MKDEELLYEVAVKNNEAAFKALFEEFYPSLCLFCKRFINDSETREDIVQSVFVTLWEQRNFLKIKSSVRNYLITCARNACVNHLHKSNKLQSIDDSYLENVPLYADSSDDLFSLTELQEMLNQALQKLPKEYREVYEMSRGDQAKNADVAQRLGVSEKTVERRKKWIEVFLKKELKEYLPLVLP